MILLPAAALTRGFPRIKSRRLLAHELAHIRRHDYLANLVQSALETLLFYHPAVWWLSARIRQERENCCDDAAVSTTADRLAYARALAAMENLRMPGGMALAAGGGRLLPRIRRILGMTPAPSRAGRRILNTTTGALVVIVVSALVYIGCNQTTTVVRPLAQGSGFALNSGAGSGPIQVNAKLIYVPTKVLEDAIAHSGIHVDRPAPAAPWLPSDPPFIAKETFSANL